MVQNDRDELDPFDAEKARKPGPMTLGEIPEDTLSGLTDQNVRPP